MGLITLLKANTQDIYKELESVNYTEVFDDDKPTIYYFYKKTCHYCSSIKDQVTKFVNAIPTDSELQLKLVDMNGIVNSNAMVDKGEAGLTSENFEQIKSVDDIKIVGTPSMMYVKDGKVKDFKVAIEVYDLLDDLITEYDLNVKMDRSGYGIG